MHQLVFSLVILGGSLLAGLLGSMTGLGGGVVLVPMLALLFKVDLHYAIGASLISVMIPKGLAAAVLASIPLQEKIPGGDVIQHVTYAMVLFSIVLTSIMTFLVDRTALGKFYARIFRGFAATPEVAAPAP